MIDQGWLSATEIAAAYAARAMSPVELVQALIDRISEHDRSLHSYITVDEEGSLDAARQADKAIAAGRRLGPLHGIPVAVKDIIDVAGQPTSCNSHVRAGHSAQRDAPVIARLRAAGAILLGKTAMHEFAIGGPAYDVPFPPARNPWNPAHHAGGSSSGSGVALAAGLVPLALGTDTAGSIRNPASMCGVVGLKPTYGLVPRSGVFPLSFTLDHVGPMARTVTDAALMLDTLAGPDAGDPGGLPAGAGSYCVDLERGAKGLRIGFVRHFHETDLVASPAVASALNDMVRVLRLEGAQVIDIELPELIRFAAAQRVIFHSESWAIHGKWLRERPADYSSISRRKLLPGAFLSAGDYVHAQQCRSGLIDAVNAAFHDVDVLLTVSSLEPACRIDDEAEFLRTYARQARSPFNLTGHPAIALMCGLSASGLPLSAQLVGRPRDEVTLLRAARAYERATVWHTTRPPLNLGSVHEEVRT